MRMRSFFLSCICYFSILIVFYNRGWDGWMASLTWWTWVWVNSGSWWWTGRPGMLRFMGSRRVGHDWVTELNWTESLPKPMISANVMTSIEVKLLSCVWLFVTRWTLTYQSPLSMGFSRQEYWSGLLFPSPGYLPNPGIKPWSPALQADALPSEPWGKPMTSMASAVYWVIRKLDHQAC